MKVTGHICGAKLYEFEGWFFECPYYGGPWPLKKDGGPRKRAGDMFWNMIDRFTKLSDKQQQAYRVGGGCISI